MCILNGFLSRELYQSKWHTHVVCVLSNTRNYEKKTKTYDETNEAHSTHFLSFSFSLASLLQSLMKKLKPLGDRVLVKRAPKEVKTASGIYLPDAKNPNEGEVVEVGPGERDVSGILHAPTLKAGDTVLLPEYGGTKVDDELVLFRESDILGKFE